MISFSSTQVSIKIIWLLIRTSKFDLVWKVWNEKWDFKNRIIFLGEKDCLFQLYKWLCKIGY